VPILTTKQLLPRRQQRERAVEGFVQRHSAQFLFAGDTDNCGRVRFRASRRCLASRVVFLLSADSYGV
jgi:hypothetical protein